MLFSIFDCKFTLIRKNHVVYPYAFQMLMQKLCAMSLGMDALKQADILALTRPGLEALIKHGRHC